MRNTWSLQRRLRSRIFPLQRVNSTPSLSYHNCFSVLPTCSLNETVEPSIDVQNPISKNLIVTPTEIVWNRRQKWERRLPSKLVIASSEDGSTSLKLKVELETTDTGEVKSVSSFVDSGATGEFINRHVTTMPMMPSPHRHHHHYDNDNVIAMSPHDDDDAITMPLLLPGGTTPFDHLPPVLDYLPPILTT